MAINAQSVGSTYILGTVRYNNIYSGELRVKIGSTNVTSNTSSITVFWVYKKNSSDPYGAYNVQSSTGTLTVNGTSYSFPDAEFDLRSAATGSTQTIMSKTVTITHTADGSKSIAIGGTHNTGLNWGGKTVGSQTVNLPNIARASGFALSNSSVTAGLALSATISRASSAFTHTVKYAVGSLSQSYTGVATSSSFTIPLSWCTALPTAASGKGTVTVTTFSGGKQIGGAVSKSFTLTVPATVVPALGGFTATRVDNGVPAAWGLYVQGKSKVALAISGAAGAYGSSIKSYSISGDGYSGAAASLSTGPIGGSGTLTYTAKITDSRGRTAQRTVSLAVQPYAPPQIVGTSTAYRANASGTADAGGAYLAVKLSGAISSVSGKNTMTLTARFRKKGSSYGSAVALTNGAVKVLGGISLDVGYEVEVSCKDAFSTSSKVFEIGTSASVIDLHNSGKGLAFGKAAETSGLMDVDYKAKFRRPVEMTTADVYGGWIRGMSNAALDFQFATSGGYHPILRYKFLNGDVGNIGAIHATGSYSKIGFYGYLNGRTANGTDCAAYLDVLSKIFRVEGQLTAWGISSTGTITSTGPIMVDNAAAEPSFLMRRVQSNGVQNEVKMYLASASDGTPHWAVALGKGGANQGVLYVSPKEIRHTVPYASLGKKSSAPYALNNEFIQRGYLSFPEGAGSTVSVRVTFAKAYKTGSGILSPTVICTAHSTVPHLLSPVAVSVSATGFTAYMRRSNTSVTGCSWVAIGEI